uniref:Uncharacterized protein n=1 Tax=Oryza punctata TaxID=4537 RepID=A0A0E0KBG9_ORYPU
MDGVLAPDVCNEDDTTGAEHDSWRTISCERECSRGDRLIKLSIIDFKKHGNRKFSISFECETLKVDKAAEEHISKYMPNLSGLDAIRKMSISGINLDEDDEPSGDN